MKLSTEKKIMDMENRLVVARALHMHKCIPILALKNKPLFDFSKPGWMATPGNISSVMDSIVRADIPKDTPFVLDLLSNYVFRFVDFDGSLLLPKKTQTGYHLPGEITLCDNRSIERLVDNIITVLDLIGDNPKVIIPPQPRYIFDGCCADSEHGINMQNEGYKEMILGNLTRIRNLSGFYQLPGL